MSHMRELKVGDSIELNDKAREWTQGKTFVVDEIRSWGVICLIKEGELGEMRTFYHATWDQIARRFREEAPAS